MGATSKGFIREVEPHQKVIREARNGLAWTEVGTRHLGGPVHPNIARRGSVRGTNKSGDWSPKDRVVGSHGFKYNIDSYVSSGTPEEAIVRAECRCGGNHGSP